MMNYPGVLTGDAEVMRKIAAAKKFNKPIDGHAPDSQGTKQSGISQRDRNFNSNFHRPECYTYDEGLHKISWYECDHPEGSAAKKLRCVIPLLDQYLKWLCSVLMISTTMIWLRSYQPACSTRHGLWL
jgi:adenine deaminase